jgi:hypothetical protein
MKLRRTFRMFGGKMFLKIVLILFAISYSAANVAFSNESDIKTAFRIKTYTPGNLKLQLDEGNTLTFNLVLDVPDDFDFALQWKVDRKTVKTEYREKVDSNGTRHSVWSLDNVEPQEKTLNKSVKNTITYVYSPDFSASGRHVITVRLTDSKNKFRIEQSWTVTVLNMENSCGDGIWNIGEDINNCLSDANKYSIPPPDKLNVLDTEDYIIGMYLFPAWHGDPVSLKNFWKPVMDAKPDPDTYGLGHEQPKKSIMNYYDDTNPVAVDWMIKWGLEHGVNLFVYDWYDSYFNEVPIDVFLEEFDRKYSAYKNKAKFALLWSNHNMSHDTKKEHILDVLDNAESKYFKHPQYFRIDNKPVFIIFGPHDLIKIFGEKGTNDLFRMMKNRMKQKGYNGLYIVINDECIIDLPQPVAFDAVTSYHYTGKMKMPVDTYYNLIKKYIETWFHVYNRCQTLENIDGIPINYLLPVSTGWDNTPWKNGYSFPMYISAIVGSTPDKFQLMLEKAREFVELKKTKPKIIIINAWDEWGETGDVLAPRADKWGFKYLESVRAVFGQ